MRGPVVPTFVLTFAALVLLILATFSLPFIQSLHFLQAGVHGDTIRFGMWGFCSESSGCTPKTLGYTKDPEILSWMTKVLVFIPIAAGFAAICALAMLPAVLFGRSRDVIFPPPLFSFMVIPAALTSILAFAFTLALSTIAKSRFVKENIPASYGPLPWMILAAMVLLLMLMIFSGCGATWRGPFGERSPYIQDRWDAIYAY